MNRHITIEHPYEEIVLHFEKVSVPPLSSENWDALAKAEDRFYRGQDGYNGYTHVMGNDGDHALNQMWDICQMAIEGEVDPRAEYIVRARVAKRICQIYALANFGPEMLLA